MSASSPKNFFVWIVLALVIVGLMGFGATNFSGSSNQLAAVDGEEVSMQTYANALSARLMAERAADGTPMTVAEAQANGVTEQVLGQVLASKVLDADAADLGVSVGDEAVLAEILRMPAFQGAQGEFSRANYRYMLEQQGMKEVDFEAGLRADMARGLLQRGIMASVPAPEALTDAVVRFSAQTRVVSWAPLSEENLPEPLPAPSDADLATFYEAHSERFITPERQKISAAVLTPEMVQESLPVDEDALRRLYEERAADYIRPERRLVERLVFGDAAQADAAAAQLAAGEASFEDLVAARGLDLSDIDLGDVSAEDLGVAAEPVFAAEENAIVGPVSIPLGAALFRVNGILPASDMPFEAVQDELRAELSSASARRLIGDRREGIEDLIAGGARLEDIVERTEMEMQDFTWTGSGDDGGLAAYAAVAEIVPSLREGDLPALVELEDGGLAALRLDGVEAATQIPFDQIEADVRLAWRKVTLSAALEALAGEYADALNEGADFDALGLGAQVLDPLRRSDVITATPNGFITVAFDTAEGRAAAVSAEGKSAVLRVDSVTSGDAGNTELAPARAQLKQALSQGIADDLLNAYAATAQMAREVTVNRNAQAAVHESFR